MPYPDNKSFLIINCGSSSLKYEVYSMPERKSLGKGLVERIGGEAGHIVQKSARGVYENTPAIPDHAEALNWVMRAITDTEAGIITDLSAIAGVGHRVVHGGEDYSSSVIIDDSVMESLERNVELAPLHNPANITGIREMQKILVGVPQVAVFDTAFHQTLPPYAYLYGIPMNLYEDLKIRRYGFHGTSHRFVSRVALEFMQRSAENTNIISCHLGNGSSITAIERGRSIDTSMGFTPLEGLIMGTRSGDIDPAIVFYLLDRGYSSKEISNMLNKQSGLLGLSGVSSDLRDVEAEAEKGNQYAQQALDAFAYRVRKYIGSYAATLVKTDILVFTGGIGEHGVKMRERICHRLENIGIHMDYELNKITGCETGIISQPYSPVTILVVPTNEELQIALDTFELTH